MDTILAGLLAELGIAGDAGVEMTGDPRPPELSSPLAVAECAVAAVAASLAAAARLAAVRAGRRPAVGLDTAQVSAAVRSEALLRDPAGQGLSGFAPLSRVWPAADGWVRTHANYPWHRAALLAAFGIPGGTDEETASRVADAIAGRPALETEELVYAAGGLAVAARTAAQWQASEPGRAAASERLVAAGPLGGAAPLPPVPPGALPAAGLRVLDLTRVIAGPAATRMLGALGADVLRVDDPRRPELPLHAVDGVIGKASTTLAATSAGGLDTLHALLGKADVLVTGYRPGALRRFGLEPDQVADRHPGTVVVSLSAWGSAGPWRGRRGFDSLVQIASGIGWLCSPDGDRPGALPCQLLDHATGYLMAAAALAALTHRARTGQATHARLSLARTARWLLDQGERATAGSAGQQPGSGSGARYRVPLGNGWTSVAPPGLLDGEPLAWPHLPPRYGEAAPAWPARG